MSVSGAFARTSARLARKDVPVAMQNWWKNIKPVEGEVSCFCFIILLLL